MVLWQVYSTTPKPDRKAMAVNTSWGIQGSGC